MAAGSRKRKSTKNKNLAKATAQQRKQPAPHTEAEVTPKQAPTSTDANQHKATTPQPYQLNQAHVHQFGEISGINNNCAANTLLAYIFDLLLDDNSPLTDEVLNSSIYQQLLQKIRAQVHKLTTDENTRKITDNWSNLAEFLRQTPNTFERECYFGDAFRQFIAEALSQNEYYKNLKINEALTLPLNAILKAVYEDKALQALILQNQDEDKPKIRQEFLNAISDIETNRSHEMLLEGNLDFYITQAKMLLTNKWQIPNITKPLTQLLDTVLNNESLKSLFKQREQIETERQLIQKTADGINSTLNNYQRTNPDANTDVTKDLNKQYKDLRKQAEEIGENRTKTDDDFYQKIVSISQKQRPRSKHLKNIINQNKRIVLKSVFDFFRNSEHNFEDQAINIQKAINNDLFDAYCRGLKGSEQPRQNISDDYQKNYQQGVTQKEPVIKHWDDIAYQNYLKQLGNPENKIMIDCQELYLSARTLGIQTYLYRNADNFNLPIDERALGIGTLHCYNSGDIHWQIIFPTVAKAKTHNESRKNFENKFDTTNKKATTMNDGVLDLSHISLESLDKKALQFINTLLFKHAIHKIILPNNTKELPEEFIENLKNVLSINTNLREIVMASPDKNQHQTIKLNDEVDRLLNFNRRIEKIMQDSEQFSYSKILKWALLGSLGIGIGLGVASSIGVLATPTITFSTLSALTFISTVGGAIFEFFRTSYNQNYKQKLNSLKHDENWDVLDEFNAKLGFECQRSICAGATNLNSYKPAAMLTYYAHLEKTVGPGPNLQYKLNRKESVLPAKIFNEAPLPEWIQRKNSSNTKNNR